MNTDAAKPDNIDSSAQLISYNCGRGCTDDPRKFYESQGFISDVNDPNFDANKYSQWKTLQAGQKYYIAWTGGKHSSTSHYPGHIQVTDGFEVIPTNASAVPADHPMMKKQI